ncbi:MAG: biopolymer transporter ExbD [Pyrinomonadaceae bacterium]|nr:biopolymer transporter ExbD [Pyrinomonadaceae bacterium]
MSRPEINVTPLIDVLLVLLIIFMVVAPLKPSSFKARVPAEPTDMPARINPNPKTLAVEIDRNASLTLNRETGLGTTADTAALVARLRNIFAERAANGDVSESFADDPQRPIRDRIERTVFIKAPSDLNYGSVARVVDAIKLAGAYPISLQIDQLD